MAELSRIKINDRVVAKIDNLDERGRGTFKCGAKDGMTSGAVPGEEVEGIITNRIEGKFRLRVEKFLVKSPARTTAPCPFFGACGGCFWQDLAYEKQCELKLQLVNNALAERGLSLTPDEMVGAVKQFRYRNRMDFVFGENGELGLKAPERWDKVVNLDSCLLLDEDATKIINIVRDLARESDAPFWNNHKHTGFWRYLVIREGKNTGERLVLLTTSKDLPELPLREKFIDALKPLATSLLWGVNPEITDLSIPKTITPLFGETYLHEKINGFSFRIPCASFFQTNPSMAAELQKTVVDFAAPQAGEKIMDLYCGSGFLTLALARAAERVIGVELDDAAVQLGRQNAELNNITNIDFRSGATEKMLDAAFADMAPDTIVIDPPRSGLHPKALVALTNCGAKKIVYVSCNPQALGRDLKALLTKYSIEKKRAIDMFPHTPHIETIVSLVRNNG